MHDAVRKGAVIRKEQQPLGIAVKPSDRIDAGIYAVQQIGHAAPPLFIGERRDIAARLIQHDIAKFLLLRDEDALIPDRDDIGRERLIAEPDGMSVASDLARVDQGLRLPA